MHNIWWQVDGIMNELNDPGHAQVHIGDNSRLNELSTVMVEDYKKSHQSRKHTRSTRNIHTYNMQEFEPIYYFFYMKDGETILSILH